MAKISVLLATYNSAPFVAELISSILNQTFSDFELIVSDDASDDDTVAVVSSFKDNRIELIKNAVGSGSAQNNFFKLLLSAKSEYIMFADADDVWFKQKIEKTFSRMLEQEERWGKSTPILVHSDLTVAGEDLAVIAPSLFKYEKLSPKRTGLKNLVAQNNVTGCTVMINDALRKLVKEQPKSSVMHDWWLALIASAFGKISVINEPLMLYRQHGDNQVGAYNASDLLLSAQKLSKKERMKAIYLSMFNQAECFAETFRESLTAEQYSVLAEYASFKNKNKLQKIASIVKHGYYKNTLLRNIGQIFAI